MGQQKKRLISKEVAGLALLFLATLAFFTILLPESFPTVRTFTSIANQLPELGIFTLAQFIPLLAGGFNLAIIATANICSLFMTWVWIGRLSADSSASTQIVWILVGIVGAVVIAITIGLLIGSIVTYAGVHPILVSLGVMTLVRGIGIYVSRGASISGMPPLIKAIGTDKFLGIPWPMYFFVLSAVAVYVIMQHTRFGKYIYMSGSNINATYYSGVNTHRVQIGIYVLSSLLCLMAGLVMTARFNGARVGYGDSYLLLTVLASILGGTDPNGGFGRVAGVVLALFTLQTITTGLNLMSVHQHFSIAMWGAVLITILVGRHVKQRYDNRRDRQRAVKKAAGQ